VNARKLVSLAIAAFLIAARSGPAKPKKPLAPPKKPEKLWNFI
jgi:hypothetical protein